MAKVAKPKRRDVSIHSRAARRGDSEIVSTNSVRKGIVEESDYKPWLHNAQNAGVAKKKSKQLTRQQRVRQQRGSEKAEINLDKLSKKVADSKSRGKKVNARRVDWDELNEKLSERNVQEKTAKVAGKKVEGVKPMEDIVASDLEPLRTAEAPGQEMASIEDSRSILPRTMPTSDANEDVDEIT